MSDNKKFSYIILVFLFFYFVPFSNGAVSKSVLEAFTMLADYAKEHVLLCLIPAFLIAGGFSVFINKQAIMKFLGPNASKWVSYSIASVSGSVLAVCSCTILPLFKGIYKRGAGLGPAVSFLYSGPAINVLAIILTAKVLGFELGVARAVTAILFSVLLGVIMHLIFKKEDAKRLASNTVTFAEEENKRYWQKTLLMLSLLGALIFLNWAPSNWSSVWQFIYQYKYYFALFFVLILLADLYMYFQKDEIKEWLTESRSFFIQVLPLLFLGVFIAAFLLGKPGSSSLLPREWISKSVGDNSLLSNFIASFSGTLMYFATLTEVPIMQGLIGAGMAKGPALALLLSGPSLSLPSILVIKSELGVKKTFSYVLLVIVLSTLAGIIYGNL